MTECPQQVEMIRFDYISSGFFLTKDVVVYGAAISACEQDGSWVEALQLMDSTSV